MIYIPPKSDCKAQNTTLGVKFCTDTILLESFLKQHNIQYEQSDLEDTPMGRGYRMKRDNKCAQSDGEF